MTTTTSARELADELLSLADVEQSFGRNYNRDVMRRASAALRSQPVATEREVRDISDEDMRDLLSAKDVGSGRAKLKRILRALQSKPKGK